MHLTGSTVQYCCGLLLSLFVGQALACSSGNCQSPADLLMQVIAGTGVSAYSGDGGAGTDAQFLSTYSVWAATNGDTYIVDLVDNRVRMVDGETGMIQTVLGTGNQDFTSVGGAATSTSLYSPWGCVGSNDSPVVFVSDKYHVWKLDTVAGTCVRYAGTQSMFPTIGSSGDGIPALSCYLNQPAGMFLTTDGVLYIAESGANLIRAVTPGGIITTEAGSGNLGFGGDGSNCKSVSVKMNKPCGVFVDTNGVVYIADQLNNRIRMVDVNGIMRTVAGGGTADAVDNVPAVGCALGNIGGVTGDLDGNIFFSDMTNNKIFLLDPNGLITNFIGNGSPGVSVGVSPALSPINLPIGVFLDVTNHILYEVESGNCLCKKSHSGTAAPSQKPATVPSPTATFKPVISYSPVASPTTAKPNSMVPTATPSFKPNAVVTNRPSFAPNHNDYITIVGTICITAVQAAEMNQSCVNIISETITIVSSTTNHALCTCNIVSITKVTGLLAKAKYALTSGDESHSEDYQVTFHNTYYMKDYPGFATQDIANQKEQQLKTKVENGDFEDIMKQAAHDNNVPELYNAHATALTTVTTITSPDHPEENSETTKHYELSAGAIAGITIGSVVGAIAIFVAILKFKNSQSAEEEEVEYDAEESQMENGESQAGQSSVQEGQSFSDSAMMVPQDDPEALSPAEPV
jgi:hypothetical protein